MQEMIGRWAFIIGFVIAVLSGLFGQTGATLTWVLVVLGLIIGFLNVTDKETTPFLLAGIAMLLVGSAGLGALGSLVGVIANILNNIVAIVAPAVLVVALKAVFCVTKSK